MVCNQPAAVAFDQQHGKARHRRSPLLVAHGGELIVTCDIGSIVGDRDGLMLANGHTVPAVRQAGVIGTNCLVSLFDGQTHGADECRVGSVERQQRVHVVGVERRRPAIDQFACVIDRFGKREA